MHTARVGAEDNYFVYGGSTAVHRRGRLGVPNWDSIKAVAHDVLLMLLCHESVARRVQLSKEQVAVMDGKKQGPFRGRPHGGMRHTLVGVLAKVLPTSC
eukprot:118883-Prymnesium_polylepis.1